MAVTLDLTEELSDRFLKTIIRDLNDESVEVSDAKQMAQEFLSMSPYSTVDDARPKIEEYVKKYPQFASLKTYLDGHAEEQKVNDVISKMKKHIENDDLDSALAVAKESI